MNINNSIFFPQLKFFNNTKSWNKVKLNEVLTERNIKVEKGKNYEHVSLTQDGVIPKSLRYERDFLVTNENKKYKITKFNDICYNPANLKFGVICRNNYKDAIFSPIYITFETNNNVLPQFIEHIVTNKKFINEALQFQQGTVFERMSVSPEDLLSININIPDIDTQKRIVTILENINNKIILEEKSINKLKNVKKALLELIFPMENTYASRLRFKGFNEDWEERKLKDVVGVYDGVHKTPDYKREGIMFLSVENIATLKSEKFISEEAFKKDYKVYPECGDVLMTRIGDVGTPNVVKTNEKMAFYVSLALLKPKIIDSYFLLDSILSIYFQKGLQNRTLLTAVPKKINKDEIGKVDIMMPSKEEQILIGNYFKYLDSLIFLHERKYNDLNRLKPHTYK